MSADFVAQMARKWAGEMLAERALEGLFITAKVRSVYEAMVGAAIREALEEAEKIAANRLHHIGCPVEQGEACACFAKVIAAAIAALRGEGETHEGMTIF